MDTRPWDFAPDDELHAEFRRLLEAGDYDGLDTLKTRHRDQAFMFTAVEEVYWRMRLAAEPDGKQVLTQMLVGRTIDGAYRIVGLIGHGNHALVFRGEQLVTGRKVAVKVLRTPFADHGRIARLKREAQVGARCEHPGVVAVHHVGQTLLGLTYIVMDFVEGESLQQRLDAIRDRRGVELGHRMFWPLRGIGTLQRGGPARRLTPYVRAVLELFVELCGAVEHIHARRIVHRDIKPANIMLGTDGHARLVDLGIAHVQEDAALTGSATLLGTLQYMAPEQFAGDRGAIGPHTDVFGLGATLYECLGLRVPYPTDHPMESLLLRHRDVVPKLSQLNREVPVAIQAIVERALQRDPAHRYPTATALREDLQRALLGSRPDAMPYGHGGGRLVRHALLTGCTALTLTTLALYAADHPTTGDHECLFKRVFSSILAPLGTAGADLVHDVAGTADGAPASVTAPTER